MLLPMIELSDGDMVLMEPIQDLYSLRNGNIVSAIYIDFVKKQGKIFLEAANPAYEPIYNRKVANVFNGNY